MLEKAQRPKGARLSWEIARRCMDVWVGKHILREGAEMGGAVGEF